MIWVCVLYFMTVWVNEILRRLFIYPGSVTIQRGRESLFPLWDDC